MKILASLFALFALAAPSMAQCQVVTTNYGFESVIINPSPADVQCANGMCAVGYIGHQNLVIPQSTAFFALSNPKTIEFRIREFSTRHPGTTAVVAVDSFGNQIILNSGILSPNAATASRGQRVFVR